MPDTSYARDLMVSIERGDVTQSSFGFIVDRDRWEEDDEGRVIRTIETFRQLLDVSPVTFPAYPEADVGLRSLAAYKATQERVRRDVTTQRARLQLLDRGIGGPRAA